MQAKSKTSPKPKLDPIQSAMETAVRLLARREHTEWEMRHKLDSRGVAGAVIDEVIEDLKQRDWLNEQRFADIFIRQRAEQGVGPLKIKAELSSKGVHKHLLEAVDVRDSEWKQRIAKVYEKRFGESTVQNHKDFVKRWRFLHQRGYTEEQIETVLDKPWN